MMQRDETQLLEPWLRYYGMLFGYQNLIVLDNGSREPEVLATLLRHERVGVQVERSHDQQQDFLDKGLHVARVIEALDQAGDYDFALPIDCDEFLGVFDAGGLSFGRAPIHRAFDALIGERRALGMEMSLTNVIGRPGWFAADTLTKGFLPADSVLDVDHGFHRPRSRRAGGVRWTTFCTLHFHNKPFPVLIEHARRKLEGLVDHHDPEALQQYRGINYHLVPYFFMTPSQFEAIPQQMLTLSAPNFVRLAAALGIDRMLFGSTVADPGNVVQLRKPGEAPVAFDAASYLSAHPDVAASGGHPLQHYLRHGWREGRALG